jgi:SAM-dependent methyltransferase
VRSDRYTVENRRWNGLGRMQLDSISGSNEATNTLRACTDWTASEYRGRLVLDAGVGAGHFAEVAARHGCEIVGVDFNAAVDCARARLGRFKNVHLIQADLSALPFAGGTFDLAYSMGVLHYTPDPAAAFACVADTVKPSGRLAIALNNRHGFAKRNAERIRRLTTRLPLGVVLSVAALSIPLHYGNRVPFVGPLLRTLCPVASHANWRRRWLDTFDWYSATYQWTLTAAEVGRWFKTNGFADIYISHDSIQVRGRKAQARVHRETDPQTLVVNG